MNKVITRKIPARTEKIEIIVGRKDFMLMSDTFRAIRSKSRHPMDKCFLCCHRFANGEMMGLVKIKGKTNAVVCGSCWNRHKLG